MSNLVGSSRGVLAPTGFYVRPKCPGLRELTYSVTSCELPCKVCDLEGNNYIMTEDKRVNIYAEPNYAGKG